MSVCWSPCVWWVTVLLCVTQPVRTANRRAVHLRAASETLAISKRAVSETQVRPGEEDSGSLCAYRVQEAGQEGRLCFRHTQLDFTCAGDTCRQVSSPGGHLVANMLTNGSVLLQWTHTHTHTHTHTSPGNTQNTQVPSITPDLSSTPTPGGTTETPASPVRSPSRGQQRQQGGFRISCWWNGSYTQFECASVILGSGCADFLLTDLHENVPYRICLQPLWSVWGGAGPGKNHKHNTKTTVEVCVEFSVAPSGMQDIVIAMTTVGGAICVMLVIICLLVAYITENIMSPSVQHTLTTRHTHSTRSHNTHL